MLDTNCNNENKNNENNRNNWNNESNRNNINNEHNSSIDLPIIKMEKGQKYETIITTKNNSLSSFNHFNSAPIGVICSGNDTILCKIFEGSHTLKNIIKNKRFIINITEDPILFTLATLKELDESEYIKINANDDTNSNNNDINDINDSLNIGLKKADAYLIATVIDIKYGFDTTGNEKNTIKNNHKPKNHTLNINHTKNENYNAGIIKAKIDKIIIKKEGTRAFNRANSYVIESLVNYSRFDIVDDIKKEEYLSRFEEAKRVINRVGGKEHKVAINKIEKEISKK